MPSDAWPGSVLVSPRLPRSLSTMAVDESATRKPVNNPACHDTPKASKIPIVASAVRPTCMPPPPKISFLIRASFSRLNSMPMVKSSKITPTCAVASTNA